jgi:hypothetical protein
MEALPVRGRRCSTRADGAFLALAKLDRTEDATLAFDGA